MRSARRDEGIQAVSELNIYENISFNKVGRPPSFDSPMDMWEKALEYFKWCESSVISETKAFSNQGEISYATIPHMRAMTQAGLCIFLNIGLSTFKDYKQKPEFSAVISAIEDVMYEQKFTGAASGMLKENIIARDLGLVDKADIKQDVTVTEGETLEERLTGGSKR